MLYCMWNPNTTTFARQREYSMNTGVNLEGNIK